MSHTLTVRIKREMAVWLEETARRLGVSQGQIVRDQLEKARTAQGTRRFMRLAGCVDGAPDLSTRKGFAKR